MSLQSLQEDIIKRDIKKLYILTGPEVGIMDIYLDKIKEVLGLKTIRPNLVSDIIARLENNNLFFQDQSDNNLFIVLNDKEFIKQEKHWERFKNGEILKDNYLILKFSDIDKRTKFYKYFKEDIIEFEKLDTELLANYIERDIGLPLSMGKHLAEICENDYARILLEEKKLLSISKLFKISVEDAYVKALEENLITISNTEKVFTLIENICKRDITKSMQLSKEIMERESSPLGVMSLLYNNFKDMLLVQAAGQVKDIQNRTGLNWWQIKNAQSKLGQYTTQELTRILRIIREAEKGIKTGKIESDLALDYILVNIL